MMFTWLKQPEWQWIVQEGEPQFVHLWVKKLEEAERSGRVPDLLLYGAPLSRSSISISGASEYPSAFRKMWKRFATYNLDEELDLTPFTVADAGDIMMHTTDVLESHARIEQTAAELVEVYPNTLLCLIGGDHSVTACSVRGMKRAKPSERIGILQLDTHLDVRDPNELGPANGTPIRQLIDGGTVRGEDVINIGLHGYYNAKPLVEYAKEQRIQMITLKAARQRGLVETVATAIQQLEEAVDTIYVTVDMDVLDIAVAPGVPASTPGGMTADELFDVLLEIGRHPSIRAIDFVCLDPMRDSAVEQTVKIGVYAWLQFITGRLLTKKGR